MRPSTRLKLPIEHLYHGFALNADGMAAQDPAESITYRELLARVEALALALLEQLPPGSHVGLCARNHIDHLVAHLAIVAAGLVWVPINPKNGPTLNRLLIQKSRLDMLLADHDSLPAIDGTTVTKCLLRDESTRDCRSLIARYRGRPFSCRLPKPDDIMGIKFTGGTTGEPKGVVQTHGNVAAVIANMQAVFNFCRNDANLAVAPLTHGGSHYIFPLLGVGGRHILLPAPDPSAIADAFARGGASVCFMPPTLIYKLLEQENVDRRSFPRLRHLTYSAAPMPPEKIACVIERLGPCLSTLYGQTEAPMTITAMTAKEMQRAELHNSVGRACRFSEVTILGAGGQPLLPGETGEVAVRGDIVMPGYFETPENTTRAFENGWLLTGDLGYLDDCGYLFLQGRSKELIISGGFNVYPAEVENALMTLPEVRECIAFGVEDDYWGERVEAAVCLTASSAAEGDSIRARVRPLLGDVKTPKAIHILDELPRNPVGKVVRREVKTLLQKPEPTKATS